MTHKGRKRSARFTALVTVFAALVATTGCHRDMWIQPKIKPLAESEFFADQAGSRLPVANTVAQDELQADDFFYTGRHNGKLATGFPWKMTMDDLKRGHERYNIYCAPCHGRLGNGQGMVAQRGFSLKKQPANYHDPVVAAKPDGHYFDVITNGFGLMFSYASRVEVADRWRIVAYIRALQLSQDVPMKEMTPDDMKRLQDALLSKAEAASGATSGEGGATHE